MSEREPTKNWWHTVPGLLTGVAALITALAGLVVAIDKVGWFSGTRTPSDGDGAAPAAGVEPARGAAASSTPSAAGAQQARSSSTGAIAISLPALREYRFDTVVFTLLGATLSPRNAETNALAVRVRMRNEGGYPLNFWDAQFRLLVDGVPQAPVAGVNAVVAAQAAEDGEFVFAVPRAVTQVRLRILSGEELSDVPLDLAAPVAP